MPSERRELSRDGSLSGMPMDRAAVEREMSSGPPPLYNPAWGFEFSTLEFEVAPPPPANLAAADFSSIFQPQPQPQPQPPRLIGQPSDASVTLGEQSVASFHGNAAAHGLHVPNRFRTAALLVMATNRLRDGAQAGVNSPGRECVLCLSAPRTIRLEPCGHGCLCEECFKTLRGDGDPSCPLCMTPVSGFYQGAVDREPTFLPASNAARHRPLTSLNTVLSASLTPALTRTQRMKTTLKVFILWVLVGAYLAAWIYAIYVVADGNSYESSIEEFRCHAAVVGCSMTCANTVRQADPDKGNGATTHEFHAPCTDCHGEQLRAAGASLMKRCEWTAPSMPALKEAQCGSNYTLKAKVKRKVEGEESEKGETSASVEKMFEVNCIFEDKILPFAGRRFHAREPQSTICVSELVGAVQVCEPGTGCAAGAHGGGGQGQEIDCYRDRDGELFLARPTYLGDDFIFTWAVWLLVFLVGLTCVAIIPLTHLILRPRS